MIGIVGISGKMGSYFASVLKEHYDIIGFDKNKHDIYQTYDNIDDFFNNDIEVLVDFSSYEIAHLFIKRAIDENIKIISGTSNVENIDELYNLAVSRAVSFVYLENYSYGISKVFEIIKKINMPIYEIEETHNITKTDISQTAISVSRQLNYPQKDILITRKNKKQSSLKLTFKDGNEEFIIYHNVSNIDAYKKNFMKYFYKILCTEFYVKYKV